MSVAQYFKRFFHLGLNAFLSVENIFSSRFHYRFNDYRFYRWHGETKMLSANNSTFLWKEIKYLAGRRRVCIEYDREKGLPVVSESRYSEIADYFQADTVNYRQHEGVFMEVGKRSNALMGAFVWRTNRGQAVSIAMSSQTHARKYLNWAKRSLGA